MIIEIAQLTPGVRYDQRIACRAEFHRAFEVARVALGIGGSRIIEFDAHGGEIDTVDGVQILLQHDHRCFHQQWPRRTELDQRTEFRVEVLAVTSALHVHIGNARGEIAHEGIESVA